jgi:hypothetical protein
MAARDLLKEVDAHHRDACVRELSRLTDYLRAHFPLEVKAHPLSNTVDLTISLLETRPDNPQGPG